MGGERRVCGYAFLRADSNGAINGKEFVPDGLVASYIEARINSDDTMSDKAEAWKTEHLKEFPFPEYPGEKFLGEDVVWIRMGRKYEMVHVNKAIYIADYLKGGLTKNRRAHNVRSPRGCVERAGEFMRPDVKWRYRLKAAVQYIVYGRFAGIRLLDLIREAPNRRLALLVCFPALIIYRKWKREFF